MYGMAARPASPVRRLPSARPLRSGVWRSVFLAAREQARRDRASRVRVATSRS